ncbi:MAG: hypothetical protein ABJH82_01425 [Polaribacter sp.]|uniref:hypothetical protein n=1 Tax=Polaribacter sp. TaxID=1920175 RepID=UPI0032665B99
MKNTLQKLSIIVVISFTFLVGCTDFFDKIDDFNVGVTNAIFEQTAVIELQDYFGNQQAIVDTDFTVVFGGADADKLVNEAGEFALYETDGFIQLNVNPNKSTGVKELNFDVTISGGDYITTTYPVTIKDTTSFITLQLANQNKIRFSGIDNISKTATLTDNALATEIDLATTKTNSIRKNTITIKTGTKFKDKLGNTLTGDEVNIYLKSTDATGINQYLSEYTFKDENGAPIDKEAKFYTGTAEITMDVNGVDVKEFTNPIEVTIEMTANANNPFTGKVVKLGDTLPIYTNEEDSEEWTYHGLGTLVAGETTETFNINFETTHLSSYSVIDFIDYQCEDLLDFDYEITAENLPSDFAGVVKVVAEYLPLSNNNDPTPRICTFFEVDIKDGNINSIINYIGRSESIMFKSFNNSWNRICIDALKQTINSGDPKGIYTLNSETEYEYEIYFTLNGERLSNDITKISSFVDCHLGINLTKGSSLPDQKTIAVGVAGNCGEKNFIPDGFPIYVERSNGIFSYEGVFNKGFVFLQGFELGKEYNFKTFYKGKNYFYKWTFNSTTFFDFEFELPEEACDLIQ